MKILAIRGKNLASLEGEFEVDFTVEPLLSAGIFAITGSTGSGKSTLLDAICLALFNDTPRISRADNADIADVKNLTVKQTDSRNILRRGTIDGYAEVDFIALSGERYSARWSVRRSRDKVDGTLQKVNYRVFNITRNEELQGVNNELLTKVKELIGLTFDQFTRAVLLAQGDFATFLKAVPREKAELLEKLTGTDIYSRISSSIYEKTKLAETELLSITEKIKDIELLPNDQLEKLAVEKGDAIVLANTINGELEIIKNQKEWLITDEKLNKAVIDAKTLHELNRSAFEFAEPRRIHLAQIDSVQSIRDDFKRLETERIQLNIDKAALEESKISEQKNTSLISLAYDKVLKTKEQKDNVDTDWQSMKPRIQEARKLDVQIDGLKKNNSDRTLEITQLKSQLEKCNTSIKNSVSNIDLIHKEQKRITQWFINYKAYENIIPRVELIVSRISESKLLFDHIAKDEKLFRDYTNAIKIEEQQLEDKSKELEYLNRILPAEVVALRAKLQENEPCPVCGSTQHPISTIDVENIEARELNRGKEILNKAIERLNELIASEKESLIRISANIENNKNEHNKHLGILDQELSSILDWIPKYQNNTLIAYLKFIAKQWLDNSTQKASFEENIRLYEQAILSSNERFEELALHINDKNENLRQGIDQLNDLEKEIITLIGSRNINDFEKSFIAKVTTADENHKEAVKQHGILVANGEKVKGVISQLNQGIAKLTTSTDNLIDTIIKWLSFRKDDLTMEVLTALLSINNDWITNERKSLATLQELKATSLSTLHERELVVTKHQEEKTKPSAKESLDSLSALYEAKEQLLKQINERVTQITIMLVNHDKGKERMKSFEKELKEKETVAENWRKLNDLLGSADGAKFKVLAQGYTLDVLLGYANNHLKDISKRYLLARASPNSLSLQVIDLDMFSEVRSVHSLSGGESFLISLSLALGLSSLSSNRMRVESLFIDEGFGTLDPDTLRVAMDALEQLQTQGRKIGVISHVTEMTERINTQIRVIKTANGRSRIEIA